MSNKNESVNTYTLSRLWFDWSFENTDKINPAHTAIYFFAIEQCNRLGWKDNFGFPTSLVKDAVGIKNYNTYNKYFSDLVEWGFFSLIEKSTNQYSANIISITQSAMLKNSKALNKALDKANANHLTKQVTSSYQSTQQSTVSIEEQYNNITIKQKEINKEKVFVFKSPTIEEVKKHMEFFRASRGTTKDIEKEAHNFWNNYEATDWKKSGSQITKWQPLADKWLLNTDFDKPAPFQGTPGIERYNGVVV